MAVNVLICCQGTLRYFSSVKQIFIVVAQRLCGRVLDLRPRGSGHEPHCVVSLSQTHLSLLSNGST